MLILFFLALQLKINLITNSIPEIRVYVFLNTECTISQQYVPRLNTLQQKFKSSGVRFTAYFPLRTDTAPTIEQFRREFGLDFPGKPDAGAQRARKFSVHVTPEVVVMNPMNRVVYQGAIDDWYVSLGRHQREAKQNYLQDALDALLAGRPIMQSRTDAVGCLIE